MQKGSVNSFQGVIVLAFVSKSDFMPFVPCLSVVHHLLFTTCTSGERGDEVA